MGKPVFSSLAAEVERLSLLSDPQGAYARLAFDIQPR